MRKILYILIAFVAFSCTQSVKQDYMPKPKGYPRVERSDSIFLHEFVDFQFQYSSDAFLEETPSENKDQVWFNFDYSLLNATLYCTYASIDASMLKSYFADNNMFIHKNSEEDIELKAFDYTNPTQHTSGRLYYFDGNAKSPYQFYLTDSTTFFLRGSLYYNTEVSTDSILPVSKSIEGDLINLMESFETKLK